MFGLGFGELLVIFLIALIFIGPKKLPDLAKGLGKGIRDFQNAAKGLTDEIQNEGPRPAPVEEVKSIANTSSAEEIRATADASQQDTAPTEQKKDPTHS